MVSALELATAKSCLEVGCGAGHGLSLLRAELDKHEPAGDEPILVATDLSGEMIALARAQSAKLGLGAEVIQKDAQDLPVEWSGKFDRVISCLCYHICPDHLQALKEMYRCTVSGGLVAFSVWGKAGDDSSMFTIMPKAIENLRKSGSLPRPAAPAPAVRSNFHLGGDDALLVVFTGHTHTCTNMRAQPRIRAARIHVRARPQASTNTCAHEHTRVRLCARTHTRARTHVLTHTCTHSARTSRGLGLWTCCLGTCIVLGLSRAREGMHTSKPSRMVTRAVALPWRNSRQASRT